MKAVHDPQPAIDALPNPLYVVFCRLCFEPAVATDDLAAMAHVLLEATEEVATSPGFDVPVMRPSPYGRFLGVPGAGMALEAAQQVMDYVTERGVRLAIGVAAEGRTVQVDDLDQSNVIGPTVNMAARLAFHPDSSGQILVTLPVVAEARSHSRVYRNCFGPAKSDQVKETPVAYRMLLRRTGRLPQPPQADHASVVAVVYDVQHFTKKALPGQTAVFAALNDQVVSQLRAVGADDIMQDGLLWYTPAGDGGGVLFKSTRADDAWAFARALRAACHDHVSIRIGIATGTVVILPGNLPVGTAVLRADALSSYPSAGAICVSQAFWQGCHPEDIDSWTTRPQQVKEVHVPLLSEAWVLTQAAPGETEDPQPPPSSPQPEPPTQAGEGAEQQAPELAGECQATPPAPPPVPPLAPLTLQQLIAAGLLNALVVAYPEQTSATMLLLAVGFPMHRVPDFHNPGAAWLGVCQLIAAGAHPGAFEPLLARAAQDYPHSAAFAPYAR